MSAVILCPVDFSDPSREALRYAFRFTERFSATLVVLNVVDPLLANVSSLYQTDLLEESRAELRTFVDEAASPASAASAGVKLLATSGQSEDEILRIADQEQAGLIVIGTQGLSGYRKLFFGSTSERVLRRTQVPVLAVPLVERPDAASPPALDPIVVPVDFSASSVHAARLAARLAANLKAGLVLLHALQPLHTVGRWREQAQTQETSSRTEAESRMKVLVDAMDATTPVETVMRTGGPADVIADVATERKAGLIVMGLQGAGGLLGSAPGSVTYRVLLLAPAPVLAVPDGAAGALFTLD
jgi:nucleotide-binding universal stress UspA family protein